MLKITVSLRRFFSVPTTENHNDEYHNDDSPMLCQWTVNIYHNSHHGCYLAVKIVSNILKKAQGRKFEKE